MRPAVRPPRRRPTGRRVHGEPQVPQAPGPRADPPPHPESRGELRAPRRRPQRRHVGATAGLAHRRQRDLPRRGARGDDGFDRRHRHPARPAPRRLRLDRSVPTHRRGGAHARRAVRPPPARGGGRDPRPPAPQARALRRHAVRGAPPRPVPRRPGGGGVRRGAPLRRHQLRAHGAPQRGAGVQQRPATTGGPTRAAAPGARGRAVRDHGPGRRWLLPRRDRPRQRHRRDRDRGVLRCAGGVTPHLRALPRGRRLPPRHPTARRRDHRPAVGLRQVRGRRGAPALPARRRRPSHPDHRAHRGVPHRAARHAHGERHARRATPERRDAAPHRDQQCPERGGEEDLRLGGDPVRPHADRHDLRDELHQHARARLAVRLPGTSCSSAATGSDLRRHRPASGDPVIRATATPTPRAARP